VVPCFIAVNLLLVANICSTSLPGGNQVDSLPPVSNAAVRDKRFEIGNDFLGARTRSRSI
jgi:hypothetical protein